MRFGHCVGGPILGRTSFVAQCYISHSGASARISFSFPFPFLCCCPAREERTSRDAGNKCMLLRKRTPFASGPLSMYAWSRCSNTDRPLRSFSFRTDTGHGQRRARGSNACFFPFLSFLFFSFLLFFTLEKSERENADKSVEGTAIKQRMPLPLIVRKVHR